MTWKSNKSAATTRFDPMTEFSERIIAELEKGVKPWVKPWDESKCGGVQTPFNAVTGHRYRGINLLCLAMDPRVWQTQDPRFCTYLQASQKGWQVKRDERAVHVFLYKPHEIEDESAKDGHRTIPILKTFAVFHSSQIDGVAAYTPPTIEEAPWTRPEAARTILENSGARVMIGGSAAYYSPKSDFIQLPPDNAFAGPEAWSATALHEALHWSGASTRLDRNLEGRFKSKSYAFEELVAEIGSAFLGMMLNIPSDIPNHASYISNWLSILKDDKKAIFSAAALAQKASDYLLGFHPDYVLQHASQPDRPRVPPIPANAEVAAVK